MQCAINTKRGRHHTAHDWIFCRWYSKSIFLYETLAIGSVTSLAPNRGHTINWANNDLFQRRIYASPGLSGANPLSYQHIISVIFWEVVWQKKFWQNYPDNKVHGANTGPTWDRQDPGGPHVGHVNLAIWVWLLLSHLHCGSTHISQNASF